MKCSLCKKEIEKEELTILYKGKKVHKDCFNDFLKQIHNEKRKELAQKAVKTRSKKTKNTALESPMSEAEQEAKVRFQNFLSEKQKEYDIDIPMALAKSSAMIKAYKFTYDGMLIALEYIFNHIENLGNGDIVGLIPYYYKVSLANKKHIEQAVQANEAFIKEKKGLGLNYSTYTQTEIKREKKLNNKIIYDLDNI